MSWKMWYYYLANVNDTSTSIPIIKFQKSYGLYNLSSHITIN